MTLAYQNTPLSTFSDLPFGEQLVLWAFRLWGYGHRQRVPVDMELSEGLRLAGLNGMPTLMNRALHVLMTEALKPLELCNPAEPAVSADEQLLLSLLASWQSGDGRRESSAILSLWLPPAASRFVQSPLAAIAKLLKDNNLNMRTRCYNATGSVQRPEPVHLMPLRQTIH